MTATPLRYGTVTKLFHWTTAALILALIPLGLIANDLPYETSEQLAQKALLFSIHKTLGVAVFAVALARILWALTQTKPGPLHPERRAETLLAETVHWVLYGALVLVPLTGWIDHAATTGFAPIWWPFGQGLPFVPKDPAVSHLFATVHDVLTKVLAAAIVLHVAGALKHHLIDKDATLSRMWFGDRPVPATQPHRAAITAPVLELAVLGLASGGAAALSGAEEPGAAPVATLEQAVSDWVVQEGDIAITVTQLGSAVTGSFADWTAAIRFDPEASADPGEVDVTIAIGSLTLGSVTNQAMGADFFDAAQFPTASFAGPISVTDTGGYQVKGTLTLKGVNLPVTLPFDLTVEGDNASMTGAVTLDRQSFGIGQSMTDESSLGFAVDVAVSLTASRAAAQN